MSYAGDRFGIRGSIGLRPACVHAGRALGGRRAVGLVARHLRVVAARVALLDARGVRGSVRGDVGLACLEVVRHCQLSFRSFAMLGAAVEPFEEALDLVPDLTAAGEAAPVRPDQPHQRVALVDRHEPVIAGAARAVHEQRLDVGLQLAEHGVSLLQLGPGSQLELRLGRTHRARVEGDHALRRGVVVEERHVDRDVQLVPQPVVELEVRQSQAPVGHQPVVVPGRRRRGRTAGCTAGTCSAARAWRGRAGAGGRRGSERCTGRSAPAPPPPRRQAGGPGGRAWSRRPCSPRRSSRHAGVGVSATFTSPASSTSNGTGSRWSSWSSTHRPARIAS